MKSLIILLTLLGSASILFAEDTLLSWNPSSDADVIGYKLYRGSSPGQYTDSVSVGNTTNYALSGLAPGVHYFAVTAYDQSGNESDFSNEVFKKIGGGSAASGGGGCAIRQNGGGPLDAAEMLVLIAAIFFLAAKRALQSRRRGIPAARFSR